MTELIEVGHRAYAAELRAKGASRWDAVDVITVEECGAVESQQALSDGDSCVLLSIRARRPSRQASMVALGVDSVGFAVSVVDRTCIIVAPGSYGLQVLTRAIRSRTHAVVHVPPSTAVEVTFLGGYVDLAAGRWSDSATIVADGGSVERATRTVDLRRFARRGSND
jgi:hypothetical protein